MSTLSEGFPALHGHKPLAWTVRLAGLALLSSCAVFGSGLALLAQEGKAADPLDGRVAEAPTGPSLVVAGYTRPGNPSDTNAPGGYLAGDPGFEGMGGTIFFAVYRLTRDEGDVWGTGVKDLDGSFVPGADYNDAVSPALDTRAKYLYVYQVVNSRGLDPISPAIFAANRDKGTQAIASMAVRLRMDPRYITSWGSFKGTAFNLAVLGEDLAGKKAAAKAEKKAGAVKPAIEEKREGAIEMAVSADPSILGSLDVTRYIWGAPAHRLRHMGLGGATLNLENSPATQELQKRVAGLQKSKERPAAWAEQMLKASHDANDPIRVRLVMFEPTADVFLQADWTTEGRGLLNLGDRSTVYGFTTDLPPTTVRGSGIATLEGRPELLPVLAGLSGEGATPVGPGESVGRGDQPANADALVDGRAGLIPFLVNLMGQDVEPAGSDEVVALAQGGGGVAPGTVVGPSAPTSFAPTTSPAATGAGSAGPGGGAGAGLPFGGPGGIGTAPTPIFGGGGTGGGTGSNGGTGTNSSNGTTTATTASSSTGTPGNQIQTATVNVNISLTNQQSQSQAQAQAQSQSQSQTQSQSSNQVVPEPWALLSAALGLPVLFYLVRRRRMLASEAVPA